MQAGGVVAGGVHGSTGLRRPDCVGCSLTQVRRQGSGRGSGFGRVVAVPAGDAAGGELIPRGTEEHRLRNGNGAREPRWSVPVRASLSCAVTRAGSSARRTPAARPFPWCAAFALPVCRGTGVRGGTGSEIRR